MKPFLFILCLLFSDVCVHAQVRKAFSSGYGTPIYILPQTAAFDLAIDSSEILVDIGIPIYKETSTELVLDETAETFDTVAIIKRKYNAKRLLTDYRYYRYYPNTKLFFGADNRILSAESNIADYDGHGNVISRTLYSLVPANSGIAAREALGMKNEYDQPAIYGHKVDFTNDSTAIKKYVDSFLKANVPEHNKEITVKCLYSYDADNNMIYKSDSINQYHYYYTYKHNADGRVAIEKEINFQGLQPYRANENNFSYTPEGKPATVNIYSGSRDSENIANDTYWIREQSYHYNAVGQLDTIWEKVKGETTKTIIAYQDKLVSSATTISIRESHTDTLHQYFYIYRKNRLIAYTDFEQNKCCTGNGIKEYYSMPTGYHTRTQCIYKHHLLVEVRTMESIDEKPYEKATSQHLYFYGTKADKKTARRSLWKKHITAG